MRCSAAGNRPIVPSHYATSTIRCGDHACSSRRAYAWTRHRTAEHRMKPTGQVTIERGGKTYAATYRVEHGMVQVRTHTESRSVELGNETPEAVARRVLDEIIGA